MRQSDITLRRFREKDAEAVADLICHKLHKAGENEAAERSTPRYIRSLSNRGKTYVALYDGQVVGIASLDFDTIFCIFADLQYPGKGIEEKLLSLMEEVAANNGLNFLKLHANPADKSLFERLGYSYAEEIASEALGKEIRMHKLV
jgi:ribosomal protein S18 acetylase RimI-like enzyme